MLLQWGGPATAVHRRRGGARGDPSLTLVVAMAVGACPWNADNQAPTLETTADNIEIGDEPWEDGSRNYVVARRGSMWAPWDERSMQPDWMLDQVLCASTTLRCIRRAHPSALVIARLERAAAH